MIKLPYGYAIDVNDGGGYSCGLLKPDKKTGKEYIYQPSYLSSVENCVNYVYNEMKKEIISDNELTLDEYLNKLNDLQKEWKEILTKVLKENL